MNIAYTQTLHRDVSASLNPYFNRLTPYSSDVYPVKRANRQNYSKMSQKREETHFD